MITAVDTNVLLDLLLPGSEFGDSAQRALEESLRSGSLVVGEVVYSELAAHFAQPGALDGFLAETSITLVPISRSALALAGRAWREYRRRRPDTPRCPRCGSPQRIACRSCRGWIGWRQHLITDFLVGAHARAHGDRLLTRDRGYYRTYFPDLRVLDPSA